MKDQLLMVKVYVSLANANVVGAYQCPISAAMGGKEETEKKCCHVNNTVSR